MTSTAEHPPSEVERSYDDAQAQREPEEEQESEEGRVDAEWQQQLEESLAHERDSLRRALRDLEAAEARVKRNAERVYDEAKGSLVHELFPVLDNLDRSIAAARARSDPALLAGVELTRKQLDEVLVRYGAERIDADGGAFDPSLHEAVAKVVAEDPARHMTVIEQLAPGYRFGSRLLRPAKVVVAVANPL
jgi:molecular chaperone GrpE